MCAPSMAGRLNEPADLAGEVLLRDFGTEWSDWLTPAGVGHLNFNLGVEFQDSSAAINAAVEGQGVILGHTALAAGDVEAGRLATPFDLHVPYNCANWFVCREDNRDRPEVMALHAWLQQEAMEFPNPPISLGTVQAPPAKPLG